VNLRIPLLLASMLIFTAPARAGEVFGGLYVHDVDTPLTKSGFEGGADIQLGYRGGRIGKTPLQPYIFGALNTSGETNYAAVGLSAKFGDRLYIRPGVGLAIHSGSAGDFQRTDRIAFGSRILFEPELGIGYQINDRVSVEGSWVHMSHAQLFGGQNPGIDNFGVRLNFGL
jgi:hypothetical protein